MAYTTEEQDFQSFLAKVRQYLPLLVTALIVAGGTYTGLTWWKQHQANKAAEEYAQFKNIVNTDTNDPGVRGELLIKFLQDAPKSALGALAILDTAKQLVEQNRLDDALRLVSAIPQENEFSRAYVAVDRAKILLELGRGEEGIAGLDAVTDDAWLVTTRTLAGDIYFQALKYELAQIEYEKARDYIQAQLNTPAKQRLDADEALESQLRYVQSRINIVQSLHKQKKAQESK